MIFLLAASPGMLAPGPQELDLATAEMSTRVERMEAVSVALGRLQDSWGERLAAGGKPDACRDATLESLVARSRAFGTAYRDAVQSSRAQLDRLEYLWAAPSVLPLLDPADRARGVELRVTVTSHVRRELEAAAWQGRHVDPVVKCEVALTSAPGVALAIPKVVGVTHPVAVIGIGGGLVCPANEPADGRVVVTDGKACFGEADCSCDPARVLPGAVIGPTRATELTP